MWGLSSDRYDNIPWVSAKAIKMAPSRPLALTNPFVAAKSAISHLTQKPLAQAITP